uniref:Uncharacterized protein n=1 Tax=Arundo donax TaxID=35708 RepID=A0A0A8XS31_ARUDO
MRVRDLGAGVCGAVVAGGRRRRVLGGGRRDRTCA